MSTFNKWAVVMTSALMVLMISANTASAAIRNANDFDATTNITAGFECNSDCTQCNATGAMVPGGCTWVPPASMYVMYTCIENNTMIQLEAFGPLKFMCSSSDPLHLTYKYAVNQCVLPPAGGYTIYHCPPL